MSISSKDIVPLTRARAQLTELVDEVQAEGREKIITKNGESCAALINAERLDHYHRLEREHIHLTMRRDDLTPIGGSLSPDADYIDRQITASGSQPGRAEQHRHRWIEDDLGENRSATVKINRSHASFDGKP